MNFPRQVSKKEVVPALRNFYKSVDENIRQTYEEFDGNASGNIEEIDFNQGKFQSVIRDIRNGNDQVTVEFYDVEIIPGATPRMSKQVNSFQLNFRYGKWFREENVVN